MDWIQAKNDHNPKNIRNKSPHFQHQKNVDERII